MLKAVAPVLFALAALATPPNDVTELVSANTDRSSCYQVTVLPTGPNQVTTICPNPS